MIRILKFKNWNLCWSWNVIPGKPYLIGAGQIQMRIENGWETTIETERMVVLHKEGNFHMYEKHD